jgi:hypothetical protein
MGFKLPARIVAVGLLLPALTLAPGCYHYQVSRSDQWAPATQVERRTVWSFLWGLAQQNVHPENCHGDGLANVRVSTNILFMLISIGSFGSAVPMTVEWQCAKKAPAGGNDF